MWCFLACGFAVCVFPSGYTLDVPNHTLLFKDERATKAVLSFLRKTRVGQMITIPPRDGETEREEAEVEGE